MQENQTTVENTKKKTKKKSAKKKFKPIYLVPIIFILIVAVVGLSVFSSVFQDGPTFGDRCAGVTTIDSTDLDNAEKNIKQQYSSIKELSIEIVCKTIAVDITFDEGNDQTAVSEICDAILVAIDEEVGLSKSNSESKYSDLFGTYNGKTQYHVDFTIEGTEEIYPIFASKHPASDTINYTYNTPRDQSLVDELTSTDSDDSTDE